MITLSPLEKSQINGLIKFNLNPRKISSSRQKAFNNRAQIDFCDFRTKDTEASSGPGRPTKPPDESATDLPGGSYDDIIEEIEEQAEEIKEEEGSNG